MVISHFRLQLSDVHGLDLPEISADLELWKFIVDYTLFFNRKQVYKKLEAEIGQ